MVNQPPHRLTVAEQAPHIDAFGIWWPQCTATTRKGQQCRHSIFPGQEWTYDQETDDLLIGPEAWATYQNGLCRLHAALAVRAA